MLPRPLLLLGCFILAVFAGKAAREAKVRPPETSASPPQSTLPDAPPMPQGMDDLETRIWLAENLTNSNNERLGEIARRLASVEDLDEKAWAGLFSIWFEKDAAAAWAFASASSSGEIRESALAEWAALDPPAARKALASPSVDELKALVRGAVRRDVRTAFQLLEEVLAVDPEARDPEDPFRGPGSFGLEQRHFAELASQDPDAAMKWAERLGMKSLGGALLWGRWQNDPAAAREWLGRQEHPDHLLGDLAGFAGDGDHYRPALMDFLTEAYPAGNDRMEAIQELLEGLAYRDPDFAAKEAARVIPDEGMRAEAVGKIAELVAKTDFAKAWSLLETLDPAIMNIQRVALPKVETRAGEESGQFSAPFQYGWHLTSMRGLESPASVKSDLLRTMMETDKTEAIRLMDRISPQSLMVAGGDALSMWMDRDYEEAVRWLAGKLGNQGDPEDLEDVVALYDSPAELHALARSLPPGTVRTALVARDASEMADTDPAGALDFAREATPATGPVEAVYWTWSRNDPLAALEHLASDAGAPAGAWDAVATKAFEKDPAVTTRAIETLPDGPARDAAISAVLETMSNSDPLAEGAWALALGDAGKRKAAVEKALGSLTRDLRLMDDPATADELRQHVEDAAGLPEVERQQWLERIDLEFSGP